MHLCLPRNLSTVTAPVLLLAAGLSLLPRPAAAQTVTVVATDRVTVRAQNVPIAALLAELAPLASMDRMDVDPADQSRPVTVTIDNVPARVAILITLRSSGVDFIFTEKRLRVGAGGKVIETPRRQPIVAAERDHDTQVTTPRPVPARPTGDPVDDNRPAIAGAAPADGAASAATAGQETASASVGTVNEFDHGLSVRNVPFVVKEDSVAVTEPGFVPYKNRPDVQRQRLATDPSTIP